MKIDFVLEKLAKPAQRAIQNEGITKIEQLSEFTEKEFSRLHGIGKSAMMIIKETMKDQGINFKEEIKGDCMTVKNLVMNNRTYRRFYQDFSIERGVLEELIDLARLSSCGANLQSLKYVLSHEPGKNKVIFDHLRWAGYLTDWPGPEEGERPSAYILILGDRDISKNFYWDHGIAAQSILLGACEKGLGGCMFASTDKEGLKSKLNIPDRFEILIVIALGKPKEVVVLEEINNGESIKYWRDVNGVHHVPKRKLEDIIINTANDL